MDLSYVRTMGPFPYWPHASRWFPLYIGTLTAHVLITIPILAFSLNDHTGLHKMKIKFYLILSVIGWLGGLTNFFYWYDFPPIPPVGNFAVTFYLVGVTYLIFQHDLLELNLVVRKTVLYAAQTLFVTLIFTLSVLVVEKSLQHAVGYTSLFGSIVAAVLISILFNPFRSFVMRFFEKHLFGKSIEDLSAENFKMMQELARQDKLKAVATFAAGMAHEVKNPLSTLKVFAQKLPEKYDDPDFREKFSRIVSNEIDRINDILGQALDFSKPKRPCLHPICVHAILDETLSLMENSLLKNEVRVEKIYEAQGKINGDKDQMKQVFLNLFLNAVQAMPAKGTLRVTTLSLPDRRIRVIVTDNGPGITAESLSKIFEPFYTTKGGGTGLGLAVVRRIVEDHGGNIDVESRLGEGSSFKISFPALPPI